MMKTGYKNEEATQLLNECFEVLLAVVDPNGNVPSDKSITTLASKIANYLAS